MKKVIIFMLLSIYVKMSMAANEDQSSKELAGDHVKFSVDNAFSIQLGVFSIEENEGVLTKLEFSGGDGVEKKFEPINMLIESTFFAGVSSGEYKGEDLYKKYKSASKGMNLKQLKKLELEIVSELEAGGSSSVDVVILHVNVGYGFDHNRVRNQRLPIFEGEEYALALMRSISPLVKSTRIFPWDLNVFPATYYKTKTKDKVKTK